MKTTIIILLFPLVFTSISSTAGDRMKSPLSGKNPAPQQSSCQTSAVKLVLCGMIGFYSRIISPADGPRSPSYPTGSAYGVQAVKKYGFFPGIFLIGDRLLHETDINLGSTITIYGRTRYYDPLRNNTFWWDDTGSDNNTRRLQ